MASKIKVKDWLDTVWADIQSSYHFCKEYSVKLTCKQIAYNLSVTPAAISNLTVDCKASLLFKIADEIYYYYQNYYDDLSFESWKLGVEEYNNNNGWGNFVRYDSRYIAEMLVWCAEHNC